MDFFIRKIFENKADELVHLQFQKFSKGEFKNKAIIEATISKGNFKISTSAEFANELVRAVAEKLTGKTHVKGIIISTLDLSKDIEFIGKKQFMGIKQYIIEKEMDGREIISALNKLPTAFFALSFKADNTELKIKPKAPKSAKPPTKGESAPKADFCKLITRDSNLAKNMLFDIDLNNSKKVKINHAFLINDIILPKDETDHAKIREMAKRKGKIIRKIDIDGREIVQEKEFLA